MTRDIFEMQTVIAEVDPNTGRIISRPPRNAATVTNLGDTMIAKLDTGLIRKIRNESASSSQKLDLTISRESLSDEKDATRLVRDPSSRRRLPSVEARGATTIEPAENETAVWKGESSPVARKVLFILLSRLTGKKNRRLYLLLLLTASLFILLLIFSNRGHKQGSFEAIQTASAEMISEGSADVGAVSETTLLPTIGAEVEQKMPDVESSPLRAQNEKVRLKDAVDAITEGRIEDAVAVYQALRVQNPHDPSFELILRILQVDRGEKE